jgi:hypothetical protein
MSPRWGEPSRGMFRIRVYAVLRINTYPEHIPSTNSGKLSDLAKTNILAKYNTVNQVDRLHGGTKPAHAVRE